MKISLVYLVLFFLTSFMGAVADCEKPDYIHYLEMLWGSQQKAANKLIDILETKAYTNFTKSNTTIDIKNLYSADNLVVRKNEEGLINAVSNIVNLSMERTPFGRLCTNQTISAKCINYRDNVMDMWTYAMALQKCLHVKINNLPIPRSISKTLSTIVGSFVDLDVTQGVLIFKVYGNLVEKR